MSDREGQESLEKQLELKRGVLRYLEEQDARYSAAERPAYLQLALEQQRKEVESLEKRVSQLQTPGSVDIPDNLPRCAEVFVGRQAQVAKCLDALSEKTNVWGVMIDGIGGIGKTELALQVAHEARNRNWFDAYLFVTAKTTSLM